jgi:hypothetical protein
MALVLPSGFSRPSRACSGRGQRARAADVLAEATARGQGDDVAAGRAHELVPSSAASQNVNVKLVIYTLSSERKQHLYHIDVSG